MSLNRVSIFDLSILSESFVFSSNPVMAKPDAYKFSRKIPFGTVEILGDGIRITSLI